MLKEKTVTEDEAIIVKNLSTQAIEKLSSILINLDGLSTVEFEEIKRGVGLSIVSIDEHILCKIYENHPDLDNIR